MSATPVVFEEQDKLSNGKNNWKVAVNFTILSECPHEHLCLCKRGFSLVSSCSSKAVKFQNDLIKTSSVVVHTNTFHFKPQISLFNWKWKIHQNCIYRNSLKPVAYRKQPNQGSSNCIKCQVLNIQSDFRNANKW